MLQPISRVTFALLKTHVTIQLPYETLHFTIRIKNAFVTVLFVLQGK